MRRGQMRLAAYKSRKPNSARARVHAVKVATFLAFNRPAKRVVDGELSQASADERRCARVVHDAIPTSLFGHVERSIGIAEHPIGRVSVIRKDRDSDR